MLPPSELKNKNFTHVIRGYSSIEVDEHIAFIIEKYTELYRENDALERKIAAMQTEIDKYRSDEESIRSALINAQRASSQILEDANERSEIILRSAKINCDKILAEFKGAVKEERDELLLLRGMVKKFKEDLFIEYQEHIEQIERIAPELDSLDESEFADEAIVRLAVESIKRDIISGTVEQTIESDDVSDVDTIDGDLQTLEASDKDEDASIATDDELVAADELFNISDAADDLDNTAVDINYYAGTEMSELVTDSDDGYVQLTYDELMSETRADEKNGDDASAESTVVAASETDDAEDGGSDAFINGESDFSVEAADEQIDNIVQLGMEFDDNGDCFDASSDFKTESDSCGNECFEGDIGHMTDSDDNDNDFYENEVDETEVADDYSDNDTEVSETSAIDVSAIKDAEFESIELERQKIDKTARKQPDAGVVESILEINDILAQDVGARTSKPKKEERTSSAENDGGAEDAEYLEFLKTVTDSVKKHQ